MTTWRSWLGDTLVSLGGLGIYAKNIAPMT